MDLFEALKEKLAGKGRRIVFTEGHDRRIMEATGRLLSEGILTPVLIGNEEVVRKNAADCGVELGATEIIDLRPIRNSTPWWRRWWSFARAR